MHILHIQPGFIPSLGYQSSLLTKFMALKGHKITILSTHLDLILQNQRVYLSDDIPEQEKELYEKYGIEIIRINAKRIISSRYQWDKLVFNKINEINPDTIFLHDHDSILGIQYFLYYLKKINIPVVSDSHMLEVASKNRMAKQFRWLYRKFVTPIIVRNEIPIFKLVDDPFVQNAYGIPKELSPLMSFGSDIERFYPNETVKNEMRKKLSIDDKDFVIVYAGKLSEDKDALFFANAILSEFKQTKKRIVYLIIGTTHGEYGKKVEETFGKSSNRIIRFPIQKYKDLPKYFQCSDIGLIPSAASLTFYDMQACGLPILWSDIDVNVVRTKNGNGIVFKNKDIDDLREKICNYANMSETELVNYSTNARNYILENYSYDNVTDKYLEVIIKEYEKRMNLTPMYK